MKWSNFVWIALMAGFFFVGYNAYQEAKPLAKEARIYNELKTYMPYTLEKRLGGYSIVSKETGIKEKPPAAELFKRLDQLEQMWGKEFLKIDNNDLVIMDKKKKEIGRLNFKSEKEKTWAKSFFGI